VKALILSPNADTGGVGIALKRAFDRHSEWSVRYVRRTNNYIDYPADITWTPDTAGEIGELFAQADVIHLMESFGDEFPWRSDAPRVIHHHGALFNRNPRKWLTRAKAENLIALVSTVDMLRPAQDELEWLPNPCDTVRLGRLRDGHGVHRMIRVVHSPTSRRRKGTEAFLRGIRRLRLRISLELIENRPWEECLARKARGDILFDQFGPAGYALNSIEAWALGLATCSGAEQWTLDKITETVGFLPFHNARATNVGMRMAELIADRRFRAEVAERGRACLMAFHDERVVVKRLETIWTRALDERA
jgi:hypothetical protein